MNIRLINQTKPIAPSTLSALTIAFATMATVGFAQGTPSAIDWADLDQSKAEAAATDKPTAFKITECPVALFEDAYGNTIDATNVHATAALELEVKRICTQRQELAQKLMSNNRRLREEINIEVLRDQELQAFLKWRSLSEDERRSMRPAQTITNVSDSTASPEPLNTPSSSFSNSEFIAEEEKPLEDNGAAPNPTPTTGEAAIAAHTTANATHNTTLSQSSAPIKTPTGCAPEYLVELAGHQRGGDGAFVWATLRGPLGERFVARAGDLLPGGIKIKSVNREVVLVTSITGAIKQLAKAPEAAPEPNDAAFSFTLIKQDQASGGPSTNSTFVLPTLEGLSE